MKAISFRYRSVDLKLLWLVDSLVFEINVPLSFGKPRGAGSRKRENLVEIVTPRDETSDPRAVISPPSREEESPREAVGGGEMERTGRGRPTHLPNDFDLQRE